jgi:hypothetical protein
MKCDRSVTKDKLGRGINKFDTGGISKKKVWKIAGYPSSYNKH